MSSCLGEAGLGTLALEDIYLETLILRILFISNNFLLILQFPQATSPEMSFLWISYNPIFLVYDI